MNRDRLISYVATLVGACAVLLSSCVAAPAASNVPAPAAQSTPVEAGPTSAINILSGGGAYQESQRNAYFKPFEKATGIKVVEDEYNFELAKIKSQVDSGTVATDVFDLDAPTSLQACAEGIIEKIDYAKLGLDKSKFIGANRFDCGVPTIIYGYVFAFDTTKLNPPPTKMADVFDLQTFPGKRGLQKSPVANLEWALIADGVAREEVYKVLATTDGVDRAFKKLDTIKSQVVWWEAGAQPPQLLADGQVAMTSAWNGRIYNAIKKDNKPFKIIWDHQGLDWDVWAVPKGAKNYDAAMKFIAFAAGADTQADQTNYISYGPANKDAIPNIKAEVLADLPTAPENMKTAWEVDPSFWSDNGDELRERFSSWLSN